MQLVSWITALFSECYGRDQRGELPQRHLLEMYFLQRIEVGRICLWVLERPVDSQICTHEKGLRQHVSFLRAEWLLQDTPASLLDTKGGGFLW